MPVGVLALIAACSDRAVTATPPFLQPGMAALDSSRGIGRNRPASPPMNDGGLAEPRAGGSVALWIETA
jgi:hypothetical protein